MDETDSGGSGRVKLRRLGLSVVLGLVAVFPAKSTSAQEAPQTSSLTSSLTLQQAVSIALEKNPTRKAVLADTRAASSEVKLAPEPFAFAQCCLRRRRSLWERV